MQAFNVKKILKLKERIRYVLDTVLGTSPTGDDFQNLLRDIHFVVSSVPMQTLVSSFRDLVGVQFTEEVAEEMAWRIAGNLKSLEDGMPVPTYKYQTQDEWALLQVLEVHKFIGKMKISADSDERVTKHMARLSLLVLGGTPAGKIFDKTFTQSFLFDSRLKTAMGFSKFDRSIYKHNSTRVYYPLADLCELTRMRFMAHLQPELCKDGINFDEIEGTNSTKKWNKDIMLYRKRINFECPLDYDIDVKPCYTCELGYDNCPAACHRITYSIGTCPSCKKPNQYFDPRVGDTMCIDCTEKYNQL